jgi:hypothetical protein
MRKEVLTVTISILAAVALVESALRIADYPSDPKWGWGWRESTYKNAAFVSDEVNEFGLRGQPIQFADGDYVVLLVGDSAVESGAQPQAVQPERILQFAMREYGIPAKVFSLASTGWSHDQELVVLRKYFERHRADAVVHWLAPENDFWEAGFIDRGSSLVPGLLKPTFVLDKAGTLSRYSVPAFRLKIAHVLALAFSRWRDGEHWGNSAIAVRSYEGTLPSSGRTPAPNGECPNDATITVIDALEHSRGWVPLMAPLNKRDEYFVSLVHALQKEIERETTAHNALYLPLSVSDKKSKDRLARIKCVISKDTRVAYRINWANLTKYVHNPLLGVPLTDIWLEPAHVNQVSADDAHINMFGNFSAFNQLARIIATQRARHEVELLRTEDMIARSKMPMPSASEAR